MTDITSLQDRLRDKAAETRGNLADIGHLAKDAVKEKLHDWRESAAESYAGGKDKLHELEASVLNAVRSSPIKALLISLGTGALLSMLWRRR
jgi:hypothetical protein